MNRLRILPGAAGIIALTATIGFVDGQRETEAESYTRDRITLVSAQSQTTVDGASPGNRLDIKPDSSAYLVEIRRGNKFSQVLVDAVTGKILLS
jgi:hypothetical protein